jgi:hypothetical protein
MINATYAMIDSTSKRSMLIEFLKYSLNAIHSIEIKENDYSPVREKIERLSEKIEEFFARKSEGKSYA